jgi:hypothetical protein
MATANFSSALSAKAKETARAKLTKREMDLIRQLHELHGGDYRRIAESLKRHGK